MKNLYSIIIVCFVFFITGCESMNNIEVADITIEESEITEYIRPSNTLLKLIDSDSKFETQLITNALVINVISKIEKTNSSNVATILNLSDVRELDTVYQVKKSKDNSFYYTILNTDKGKFFVFFYKDTDLNPSTLEIDFSLYSEKKLEESDFNFIPYITTLENVKVIDPATEFTNTSTSFIGTNITGFRHSEEDFDKISVHMICDGVMFIGYHKIFGTYFVTHIEKIEDYRISGIHEIDR